MRFNTSGQEDIRNTLRVPWYESYDDLFVWRERADYEMDLNSDEILSKAIELFDEIVSLMPLVENYAATS